MTIDERASTHVYHQKQMFSEEELAAREQLCIYEEPAYCNAACPLKIDINPFLLLFAKGDFDKRTRSTKKIQPFPHLLAEGCEAPCEKACKLREVGEGLAVGASGTGRSRLMARLRRRAADSA